MTDMIDTAKIKRLPPTLTQEQLEELKRARSMPITFDEDCPELTREQAMQFHPLKNTGSKSKLLTAPQALAILGEVYASCKDIFTSGIQDAFLYGSHARGDYHEDSDVDILLTVDEVREEIVRHWREVSAVSSRLSLKYDVTVSVTVKPLDEFRRYADVLPFYKNVLREGIRYDAQRV